MRHKSAYRYMAGLSHKHKAGRRVELRLDSYE